MRKIALIVCCFFLIVSCKKEESKNVDETATTEDTITKPAEIANSKYADIGKKIQVDMEKGDIGSMMEAYADNAVYVWNGGDSLVGKPAIESYWKERRANVIETISFKDAVWLPIKVNLPQGVEAKGVWLHAWSKTTAKFKNGKEVTQWVHTDYHFDSIDKVDRVVLYVDKAAINAALAK